MSWMTVLKMPNPFGGNWQTLTGDQYYKMDDKNKELYHKSMSAFYDRQIQRVVKPRKAGQPPPATDDDIRGLRELSRFHSRQLHRFRPFSRRDAFYSLDEENNRVMMKPTYDAVERIPNTTKEMYDNYSRKQKENYWRRVANDIKNEFGWEDSRAKFAKKQADRMKRNPNYTPPFEGEESTSIEYKDKNRFRDVSEYDDFTDEEKIKYHGRHNSRLRPDYRRKTRETELSAREKELSAFHQRMRRRAVRKLPTYPTPEAEKEAEQ